MLRRRFVPWVTVISVVLSAPLGARAQAPGREQEETARRLFQSGMAFLGQQRYAEAVKDFTSVATSFPSASVADDAWLELARYHLEVAGDLRQAEAAVDAIAKQYPASDSAAMALVLAGRVRLANGRTPENVESALASFDRVPRLYPASPAIPVSSYYAGETLRLAKRIPEALERYRQVTLDYPTSPWSARALLGAGQCLTATGQWSQAMQQLQRVGSRFPGTPEAHRAVSWNTILFRLYVRAPSGPAYAFGDRTFAGPSGKLKDVEAIAAKSDGVLVATRTALLTFDPGGKIGGSTSVHQPRTMFLDAASQPVVTFKTAFQIGGGPVRPIAVPKSDGGARELDGIPAGVGTSAGDLLLADGDAKAIVRFSPDGKHLGTFATLDADHLAINGLDEVAGLVRDDKSVTILDRVGVYLTKIPAKGANYELRNPVAVAYDALGHLYVLDRGRQCVHVFSHQAKLLVTFTVDPNSPVAFREPTALAVDPAGRLYIYDERTERVLLFQ